MTQQPYYPPQQGYPAPAQPQYPQAPQQVAAAPQYPQQAYPAPAPPPYSAPPQQPPAQPLAQGTIDDYYSQPSTGGGPSISWSNKDGSQKPIGTSYAGIVARDVTNADIQQETDYKTQQPKHYRDGRPKFAMKVPLRVQPGQEHPDGEAAFYVKGQARDELVRAMGEAGCTGAPVAGAGIVVTLVQRKPMGAGMNPANVVQIQYQPPGGQAPQAVPSVQTTEAPAPAPQPVQQVQYEQAQPVQQQMQQAPAPQPVQQQAPQQAAPQQAAPQPPAGLDADQQALLARLTGQQG